MAMFSNGSRTGAGLAEEDAAGHASARERLIAAAAAKETVLASECSAASSVVTHGASAERCALASHGHAAKIKLDKEPAIKTPDQFTFIGKPMPRIDVVYKIDGSANLGIDAQVPDMVFAAITACPVQGGKPGQAWTSTFAAGAPWRLEGGAADIAVAVVAIGSYSAGQGAARAASSNGMSAKPAVSTAHGFANTVTHSAATC